MPSKNGNRPVDHWAKSRVVESFLQIGLQILVIALLFCTAFLPYFLKKWYPDITIPYWTRWIIFMNVLSLAGFLFFLVYVRMKQASTDLDNQEKGKDWKRRMNSRLFDIYLENRNRTFAESCRKDLGSVQASLQELRMSILTPSLLEKSTHIQQHTINRLKPIVHDATIDIPGLIEQLKKETLFEQLDVEKELEEWKETIVQKIQHCESELELVSKKINQNMPNPLKEDEVTSLQKIIFQHTD